MHVRIFLLITLAAIIALVFWRYTDIANWDWLADQESRLRESVAKHPIASFWIGFSIYLVSSLVPGTTGKSIVYGWLFGFWQALLIASTSLTIAAVISFLVVRYLLRDMVEARLTRFIHIIDSAVSRHGATWLISLRLLHAPYSLTNYASGATSVSVATFAWTTQVGMLPGNIVFVLAGSSIPSLRVISQEGVWSAVDIQLLVLLSLLAFLPILGRWANRWFFATVRE